MTVQQVGGTEATGYRLVCEIARGGMGRVELVVRQDDDFVRLYARKRLLSSLGDDEEVRAMFRDEARIAGMLRHPNVVSVHDVGEDPEGLYLVMDYVEGIPLGKLVAEVRRRGSQVPIQLCARVIRDVAEGLHAAHELRGLDGTQLELVHRDVSPSNILVELNGVVRVVDFGIAKAIGRRARTSTGLLKGKTGYLAPEVLRFEPSDRRADLFSLGVVLFELAAGRRLYPGAEVTEVARRIMHEPAPDLGAVRNDVPDLLVELCFELLAKDPEHRPATGREVASRLDELLRDILSVEDPIHLEDYVRAHADRSEIEERRRLAEEMSRSLQAGRATKTPPTPTTRETPAPGAAIETTADLDPLAGSRRRTWPLVAGALLLLAAGSAVGFVLSRPGGDEPGPVAAEPRPAPPTASEEPTQPATEPVPEATATARQATAQDEPRGSRDSEDDSVRPPEEPADEPDLQRERQRRRRGRAARRAAMDTAPSDGQDLQPWDWD